MGGNVSVVFALTLLLGAWPLLAARQIKATPPVVSLPRGEVNRIPSPNGKWALIFQCPNNCSERKLWVEETSSHARKQVKEYERSLDISWAPDSRLFFVNDNSGSTDARCYQARRAGTSFSSLMISWPRTHEMSVHSDRVSHPQENGGGDLPQLQTESRRTQTIPTCQKTFSDRALYKQSSRAR